MSSYGNYIGKENVRIQKNPRKIFIFVKKKKNGKS